MAIVEIVETATRETKPAAQTIGLEPVKAGPGSENAAGARAIARREALLRGPIIPLLLGLAAPTVVVLVVQTLVGVAETYFVSFLGTDAIAGVALVFPVLMLMQMMSNGGIGGGVSSAVARALGANRRADADALIWHAIVLACAFGFVFMAAAMLGGPVLYRAMGGTG